MATELIIGDDYQTPVTPPGQSHGLIPRDYTAFPQGCYGSAPSFDLPLIPRSEWSDRIKDMETNQSRLSDIRLAGNNGQMIPALDQNGKGYCWAHSTTGGEIIMRAVQNQPYVPLSAYAVACVIKNFRDEGGWGALSLDFITTRGVPSSQFWPMQSMDRKNDNPQTWADAAKHKIIEGWVDLNAAVYDRDLTFDQVMTLLLSRTPVVVDYNWWSHSILALDPVELKPNLSLTDPNRWGVRILNSWGDSWSDRGMGVLAGTKAVPDGAVAPRVVTPS